MDISIIIPYNINRGYLEEAIKSCEDQDFIGTYEIIVEKNDYNVAINRNAAIKRAKGKYIKLLDEDDVLPPGSLRLLFDNKNDNDLTIGNFYIFNDGSFYQEYECTIPEKISKLAARNTIAYGSILYRKQSILDVGGFNESLITGEDFELTLRLADYGCKFNLIPDIVFGHRKHIMQKSDAYYQVNPEWVKKRKVLIDNIRNQFINNHKIINIEY